MIKQMIFCFMATFFFALIMNSPKKAIIYSSAIASSGYLVYSVVAQSFNELAGYFLGTLIIAFLGEICARKIKMPATIFIFPAVVPLVPGIGLYEMMLAFVQDDILGALKIGTTTVFIAGVMAISMAIINLVMMSVPVKNK